MNADDRVFLDICNLLNKNNINYWVCHGTLLGIIRESRLLPWDHDIDFAVWEYETDKNKIVSILESNGYRQEFIFGDMDCLHFMGGTKKIDVSFYRAHNGIASVKWAIGSNNMFGKLLISIASRLDSLAASEATEDISPKNLLRKLHRLAVENIASLLRWCLPGKVKCMLRETAINKMRHIGYSYPVRMLDVKKIEYNGLLIPVPADSEGCLRETYGENWRTPNKNYVWHQEANNLVDF